MHDLTKHFPVKGGTVRAVDGVSFEVATGGSFGIVGESGCGKTTIARMLVRLTDPTAGHIVVEGRDITCLNRRALRSIRPRVQIVFQDPSGSLNPRQPSGRIVAMPMRVGGIRPPGGVRARVRDLLAMVGLNPDHEGGTRTSSPAVSGSGSGSPGRWPAIPGSSSRTNRCRHWTRPSRRRSST